ncbi:hypothetical protein D9M68_957790 [compost metagenome]
MRLPLQAQADVACLDLDPQCPALRQRGVGKTNAQISPRQADAEQAVCLVMAEHMAVDDHPGVLQQRGRQVGARQGRADRSAGQRAAGFQQH